MEDWTIWVLFSEESPDDMCMRENRDNFQCLGFLIILLGCGDTKIPNYNTTLRDYNQFLNHGYKSGQMSKEFSKLKVDILGQVLKKHVTQLRSGIEIFQSLYRMSLTSTTNCHYTFRIPVFVFDISAANSHNLSLHYLQESRRILFFW